MAEDRKKDLDNQIEKIAANGPGDDGNCHVCIFAKSQALGDCYDLNECPKCRALLKKKL